MMALGEEFVHVAVVPGSCVGVLGSPIFGRLRLTVQLATDAAQSVQDPEIIGNTEKALV